MNSILKELDLKYIFHPCSQMKDYEKNLPLIPIKKAKGIYLEDFEGNRYIDGISSWWVNLFGHNHEYINSKLKEQLEKFEHIIFAGFTHEAGINLAKRIIQKVEHLGLSKVFFADNGSSAIEVAIKLSFQYFKNKNQTKPFIVSLQNSYHGETLGALSIGDVDIYKKIYDEILIKSIQAKSPALYDEDEAIFDMEQILKSYHEKICAVIIEPLVQCAGSMKMYNPSYITKLRELTKQYNVHLIADEIAVGFGRTGTLFATEQANCDVDLMALSKGLTGGYMPLALTLMSEDIYQSFYCDYNSGKSFLHSHSYTANPLSCACANAVLDIFENENILDTNKDKILFLSEKIKKFKELKNVKDVRQTGFILAVELDNFNFKNRDNLKIYNECLNNGLFVRPLGNVLYFMPPYIIDNEEIEKMINISFASIKRLNV